MNLSKNFSLKEMLATSTGVANVPTDQEIEKMKLLSWENITTCERLYGNTHTN